MIIFYLLVTNVKSCKMESDLSLNSRHIKSGSKSVGGTTDEMFTKCVPGTSGCSNCVASGYELVNVTYVIQSENKQVTTLAYRVTGCKCVANEPLNSVVKQKSGKSYMHGKSEIVVEVLAVQPYILQVVLMKAPGYEVGTVCLLLLCMEFNSNKK